MRTLGAVFLIGCLMDACLSILATLAPSLEDASNALSMVMVPYSVLVFVLTCLGKVGPRSAYLPPTIFYGIMVAFALALGIFVGLDLGPEAASTELNLTFLRERYVWYMPIHWTILLVWTATALYGLWKGFKGEAAR